MNRTWRSAAPMIDMLDLETAAKPHRQLIGARWRRYVSFTTVQSVLQLRLATAAKPPLHDAACYKAIDVNSVPGFVASGTESAIVVRSTRRRFPMRALMLIAAAGLLASCSSPTAAPRATAADLLAGRVAGPAQTCISTNNSENIHALDAQTLAYGSGRTIYVNRLQAPCPAIGEFNLIIVEAATGNQYCRGDRVRGRETGAIIAGPSCNLNDWVPYRQP